MTFSKTMNYRGTYVQASIEFWNDDQEDMDAFQKAMVETYQFGLQILLIILPKFGGSKVTIQLTKACSQLEFFDMFAKAMDMGWKKPGGK